MRISQTTVFSSSDAQPSYILILDSTINTHVAVPTLPKRPVQKLRSIFINFKVAVDPSITPKANFEHILHTGKQNSELPMASEDKETVN